MNDDDDDYTITIGTTSDAVTFSDSISTICGIDSITSTTFDNITINTGSDYGLITDDYINPDEVERMCKEYPALTKVWRNFKSVYDMTLQDYKGKKEVGEIDDQFPF